MRDLGNVERFNAQSVSLDATVGLTIQVRADCAGRSLISICDIFRARSDLLHRFSEFFPDMIGAEGGGLVANLDSDTFDLLWGEPVLLTTGGTFELILKPGDRYLEFVATITGDGDVSADFDLHGWPVLFLRGDSAQPTIAEGGAAVNPVLDGCSRRTPGGPR